MLDYRIYTFISLCETRSYTKTAEQLHISQPSVSQHIKALEQHYGERKASANWNDTLGE